jgi:hypothetical protein
MVRIDELLKQQPAIADDPALLACRPDPETFSIDALSVKKDVSSRPERSGVEGSASLSYVDTFVSMSLRVRMTSLGCFCPRDLSIRKELSFRP